MKVRNLSSFISLTALIIATLAMSSCSSTQEGGEPATNVLAIEEGAPDTEPEKYRVKIVHTSYSDSLAVANLAKVLIEEGLGEIYEVELLETSSRLMFASIREGRADVTFSAYKQKMMKKEFDNTVASADNLGPNFNSSKKGIAVPSYMNITSYTELTNAGVTAVYSIPAMSMLAQEAQQAVQLYGKGAVKLKYVDHDKDGIPLFSGISASDAALRAYKNKENFAFTAWRPQSVFAKHSFTFLEDPAGIFDDDLGIYTIARKGLKGEHPKLHALLDNIVFEGYDFSELLLSCQEEDNHYKGAVKWLINNPEKAAGWASALSNG